MQQEKDKGTIDTVLVELKAIPIAFIPQKDDLDKVISEREAADRRLNEAGRSVILREVWQTE